ncbi:hypothetical protein GCM10010401_19090 [Rarobacter faecitabidus]
MGHLGSRLGVVGLALAVVGWSLTVTSAEANADDSTPSSPLTTAPDLVSVRVDTFSAIAQARLQGSRVEGLSQRTESSQTFVNPDGTWTLEDAGAVVCVQG